MRSPVPVLASLLALGAAVAACAPAPAPQSRPAPVPTPAATPVPVRAPAPPAAPAPAPRPAPAGAEIPGPRLLATVTALADSAMSQVCSLVRAEMVRDGEPDLEPAVLASRRRLAVTLYTVSSASVLRNRIEIGDHRLRALQLRAQLLTARMAGRPGPVTDQTEDQLHADLAASDSLLAVVDRAKDDVTEAIPVLEAAAETDGLRRALAGSRARLARRAEEYASRRREVALLLGELRDYRAAGWACGAPPRASR